MDDFKRRIVEAANRNDDRMDGTMGPVEAIIADNEIVFAVWQDAAEPDGVGTMIVKGQDALRRCAADDTAIKASVSAISCINAEQATALVQVCGERDRRH